MTTFYGGTPPVSFTNDDLYRLGKGINGATGPSGPTGGTGGTGGTGSTGSGPIVCPGFASTVYIDLPWGTLPRQITSGFTGGDVLVIKLNPPAGVVSSGPGSIGLAEWGGDYQPYMRTAILSTTPCDLTPNPATYNYKIATNIKFAFQVGGVQQPGIFLMQAGVPYYLTLVNQNQYHQQTVPNGHPCNMSIDLTKPPGT